MLNVKDYIDEVVNPDDITGLKKVYEVQICEMNDMYKRTTFKILANTEDEARDLVDDKYAEWDLDWGDEECSNIQMDIDHMTEVK